IPVTKYNSESYGTIDYDPRHLLPFLADLFGSAPRNSVLAWMGLRHQTLEMFAKVWSSLGFTEPILVDAARAARNGFGTAPGVVQVDEQTLLDRANVFVIDFGSPDPGAAAARLGGLTSAQHKAIGGALGAVIAAERLRFIDSAPLRRIACLNAIHTPYEG